MADTTNSAEGGTFFQETNTKLEEIRKNLESPSVGNKLDSMKRLIAMISKGRDVRNLFPNVVKNVICDNAQVKRLVYMYLIHYAEFEQDLALLSINTFQKDLDNPNALIRAQALRVLTSIRLRVITHILIISVQRCVSDNSPYVRKTAAHAIPKIFSLDPEKKEELVDCIETLLGDNTTLVLGSAICAFSEICPERIDLLHPHFRKLCNMLADIDEWGQISILNILTRYAKTQFGNPNPTESMENGQKRSTSKKASFYSDDESADDDDDDDDYDDGYEMDSDHRLLLRAAGPLLQSKNSGVVVAVSTLMYYCAPAAEALKIGKSLVRIVRNPPQISYLVLSNIKTLSDPRPDMFSPYLSEFYVYETDPRYIREVKLDILTNIASESNINKILKELSHYAKTENKEFAAATIQAIGTSATRLPEVQETCMQRLISLLSNRSEVVVAESVVVIKKLLQCSNGTETKIITHLAKLLENITEPKARASIIWIVGEYCQQIPLYAPDILRKLVISFKNEDKLVKLQILTLASKLVLRSPLDEKLSLMFQYAVNMAKFDMNYDIRDRARVFRTILLGSTTPQLKESSLSVLCSDKPAPELIRTDSTFALGSLSHIINHTAYGYLPLGEWPTSIPDPSTRDKAARRQRNTYGMPGTQTPTSPVYGNASTSSGNHGDSFYSDSEEDSEIEDYTDSYDSADDDASDFYGSKKKGNKKPSKPAADAFFGASASGSGASSFFDDSEGFSDSEEEESAPADPFGFATSSTPSAALSDPFSGFGGSPVTSTPPPSSSSSRDLLNTDLLGLSLDVTPNGSGDSSGSGSGMLVASPVGGMAVERGFTVLLKQVISQGLQVEIQFLRRASMAGVGYNPIKVVFKNESNSPFQNLSIQGGEEVAPFDEINIIPPHSQAEGLMNVKFSSASMPIKLKVCVNQGKSYPVELSPQVGELISQSTSISSNDFLEAQKKLGGMQEVSGKFACSCDRASISSAVLSIANVSVLCNDATNGKYYFAGSTIMDEPQSPLLISVEVRDNFIRLKVNCNNAIFGTTLHRQLKHCLETK